MEIESTDSPPLTADDLQVPLDEHPVDLALEGQEPATYVLFLSRYSERHSGAQTFDEYLNGSRNFLPASRDGEVQILNRDQIAWIRTETLPLPGAAEGLGGSHKRVVIELTDASILEGEIFIDRPPAQSRVSDALNDSSQVFIRLDDESSTYFVNKRLVRVALPR